MSGDHAAFAAWLRERAKLAGYDLDERGMTSRLAEASGIDSGQMSRAVRGLAIPAIEGQRGLARVFRVPLSEAMIRAGWAEPEDFDMPAPVPQKIDLVDVAAQLDVPEDRRATFASAIETIAAVFVAGDKMSVGFTIGPPKAPDVGARAIPGEAAIGELGE
jgi:transcriptional regulator with XRE-family HTH domain